METSQYSIQQIDNLKSRKPLLYIGIISMSMVFVGLSSAYLVSKHTNAKQWIEVDLTPSFLMSTIAIILSSILVIIGQRKASSGDLKGSRIWYLIGLLLGFAFCGFQWSGFGEIYAQGIAFSGMKTAAGSYLYILVALHLVHMLFALGSLIVVNVKLARGRYKKNYLLGLELAGIFWHYLGILWIYLYIFLQTANSMP